MTRVHAATTSAQLADARSLRVEVFVREQGVPPQEEFDQLDIDPNTIHCVLYDGNHQCVATGRLLAPLQSGDPHIGRVAVSRSARHTGAGRAVMNFLESAALERYGENGTVLVRLSAQSQAIPFYEAIGYTVEGPEYIDAGIAHRDAFKVLVAR